MSVATTMSRAVKKIARRGFRKVRPRPRLSAARVESNRWLRGRCANVLGDVLSIGSGDDEDKEGAHYRDYFVRAASYTTSEITPNSGTDIVVDVRDMHDIADGAYDCVFCSGVLEHVDNYVHGFGEISRILKSGGVLLLGVPFRQGLHMPPNDFWRFTEYGIRYLMKDGWEIVALKAIDEAVPGFAASYWVEAKKKHGAVPA